MISTDHLNFGVEDASKKTGAVLFVFFNFIIIAIVIDMAYGSHKTVVEVVLKKPYLCCHYHLDRTEEQTQWPENHMDSHGYQSLPCYGSLAYHL